MSSNNTNPPTEFSNELVYALSSILHIREHVLGVPARTNEQRKHLRLLNGIALLLITESKGDVAAVSLAHTATSIRFYFSKNRPCTLKEKEYIGMLLALIKGYHPSKIDEWSAEVLGVVLRMCIKKVKARLRKIASELRRCGLEISSWGPDDIDRLLIWRMPDHEGDLARDIAGDDPAKSSAPGVSDRQIMVSYLHMVVEFAESRDPLNDIPRLIVVITLSLTIGFALRTDPVLSSPILIRRIQKLGDYVGAIRSITSILGKPDIYHQRDTIKFEEIQAPGQSTHLMPRNFLKIVNDYATFNGKPTIKWGDICNYFPSLRNTEEPPKGDMKVTTSIHCECIMPIGENPGTIGIRDRHFQTLLLVISTRAAKFVVSGFQGKIHAGWRPPSSPAEVVGRVTGLVAREMDEILGNIQRTNRSDSCPGSPGEGTENNSFTKKILKKYFKDTFRG
ncbi:MAG: hypothetical protein M1840_005045 [Geoglossum simile]|nr:MAG: hypothetical protein M1840_005045 [Geoglossum simile]